MSKYTIYLSHWIDGEGLQYTEPYDQTDDLQTAREWIIGCHQNWSAEEWESFYPAPGTDIRIDVEANDDNDGYADSAWVTETVDADGNVMDET